VLKDLLQILLKSVPMKEFEKSLSI